MGAPGTPATRPARKRSWWPWLLFFLSLVGLGGLCFVCWSAALPLGAFSPGMGGSGWYAEPVSGPALGPVVAVVMLQGPIVSEGSPGIAVGKVENLLRRLKRDSNVRAVVLHINSPGGSVAASERLLHVLQRLDKPLVAYFDEVAASGGYYIAMAADTLIANPACLTGSIGVIAIFPHGEALMDKVGIRVTVIKSGQAKDMGSFFREMTPEERKYMQRIVDEMYERFVEVVAQGRHMDKDTVRKLADGRVYTARQAQQLGLIDALGFEEDAIRAAAQRAGLTSPRVVRYYPGRSLLQQLLQGRQAIITWPLALQPGLYYLWLP